MKKYMLLTAAILVLAAAVPASAQTAAPVPGTPATTGVGPTRMTFAEHKAALIERLQKRLACVQAATNRDQMRACGNQAKPGEPGAPQSH